MVDLGPMGAVAGSAVALDADAKQLPLSHRIIVTHVPPAQLLSLGPIFGSTLYASERPRALEIGFGPRTVIAHRAIVLRVEASRP